MHNTNIIAQTIFISHANEDKEYVDQIVKLLDPAKTFYDIKSMQPGEKTIDAMKNAAKDSAVFVLFHSPNSRKTWVEYETELAEFQIIENRYSKILVCPIKGETHNTLPEWMKKHFTCTEKYRPNDICRTIAYLYRQYLNDTNPKFFKSHPGREVLLRQISIELMRASANTGKIVNALALTGVQGMGRATLAAEIVTTIYKNMRAGGPVFEVPHNGDGVDWHLQFCADLNGNLTSEEAERQRDAFNSFDDRHKAEVLLSSLQHWGDLNQVVTIRHRWGLRNKGNSLPQWFKELLIILQTNPGIRLILISERQLPRTDVDTLGNVLQFHLEELDNTTIQFILQDRVESRYLDSQQLPEIADKIKGHPATANFAAYLINGGKSMESLTFAPDEVLAFQDRILKEIYEKNILTTLQKQLLRMLCWFPRLSITVICEAFSETPKNEILQELWELVEFSLIDQSDGGKYKVPAVVSSTYRRLITGDDSNIFDKISNILKLSFDKDDLDFDLIESLLLVVVSTDQEISERILSKLTPGRVEPVVENLYHEAQSSHGAESRVNYSRCFALASLAMKMNGSDESLENILFYGADASVRLGKRPDEMLSFMREKGFRAADFIEASYLYHTNRDFEEAAKMLSRSLEAPGYKLRNVRLLTRIYLRSGDFQKALDTLDHVSGSRLLRDTGLVMMKIKALKGVRNRGAAEELLRGIRNQPDAYGEISIYHAAVALREQRYPDALSFVQIAKQAPRANKVILSVLECACQIESGDLSSLAVTCDLARSLNREADALQLMARAALVRKDWKQCEEYIKNVQRKDWFDFNVEYRAIELKLLDPEIKRNPVVFQETLVHKDALLRKLSGAVEGTNFA